MKTLTLAAAAVSLLAVSTASGASASPVTMDWVTVGNAGNAADPTTGFGAVDYEYNIATKEVTNSQYAAFLNSVAASDPNGLYSTNMGSDPRGGITRSGSDGSYTYSVRENMGDKPVNYVSWYDAARMSNWMTNGQGLNGGSGDTESGVYTFTGATSISAITRDLSNPNQVFIPTEDEWYKAAYHQPFAQGGDSDDYWLYATQSNSRPAVADATSTGDVANPGQDVVNYLDRADWNGQNGNVTTVGSAGSTSFYGAFDMNGNLWEWNETLIRSDRGLRGGSFVIYENSLGSSDRNFLNPMFENDDFGFRLAAAPAMPEMDWVTVGNAGNAADPTTGFGSVDYDYRIGTYEVTNSQYAAFLNAVAASDPNGLYNPSMGSDARGGITRSGSDGSYTYSVRENMGDKPVNLVSWYDAARMSNWMTNGQGSGGTEFGVYTFDGATSISGITRDLSNPNQVFIPNEDEWYKAAYHQPAAQGGDSDDYWLYATQSNIVPMVASATSTGDVANPGQDVVNLLGGARWNGQKNGNVTTVGSAGSTSFYGAFDMNGNLWEWNETLIGSSRGLDGGSFISVEGDLRSSNRNFFNPTSVFDNGGFRLASPVSPSTSCPADLNDDGIASVGDILDFLGRWANQSDPRGDFNNDGVYAVGDILDYLGAWSAGCP